MSLPDGITKVQIERDLSALQRVDGGVAASAAAPPNTEATALASLTLPRDSAARAREWLLAHQLPEGGWAITPEVRVASWATSLALLALARHAPTEALARGLRWMIRQKGRRMPLVSRLAQLMLPPGMQVDQDFSLEGWPWNESAQAWIEPTAFALLALRKAGSLVAVPGIAERIQAGEALVWDRMCDGGGWNYGNKRVFGEHLEPFADVTACALLGMHASHQTAKAKPSLDRLEGLLRRQSSGLALSLGALAFAAYGRRTEEWIDRLIETYAETGFRAEARSLALSLIALRGEVEVLLS